jgi:hypothetical protein
MLIKSRWKIHTGTITSLLDCSNLETQQQVAFNFQSICQFSTRPGFKPVWFIYAPRDKEEPLDRLFTQFKFGVWGDIRQP